MEVTAGAMIPLLDKLGKLLVDELNLENRVKKGIRSLHTELELMHATVLKVGEVLPDQLDPEVRIWAGKVKDLSYDMEDVVDGFMVRVKEDHDSEPTNLKNKVKKLLKKTTRLFTKGKALHQISSAIQDARELAKELAEQHNRYKLEMPTTGLGANIDPRLIDMYKDVTQLVGVEEARDELIQRMKEGDEGSKLQLKTISIVGFGGLGKTTLARAVYDKIKVQFDCWAFVPVSQNPDMKKILKDMLYELDKEKFKDTYNTRDERLLIDELREFLKDKRFLIIIDDIWDEIAWRFIKCALPENSLDSQVITTTRIVSVAEACRSSNHDMIHTMKPLSDKDAQRLFYGRIFDSETGCPDHLQEVSRDILKKCGGVPLAIIAIASLLASNHGTKTKDQWCHSLRSIGRGLAEDATVEDMRRILSFSYYDLPSHLKACLLYLSIFPEDYKIKRERLIWRWIAEGFIHPKEQETSLFKLGESYFNELVNRSMIMPVDIDRSEDKAKACRVHDMVLDLICSLSREENFVTTLDDIGRSTYDLRSKVRRLSLQNTSMTVPNTPRLGTMSMSQVRSVSLFMPGVNLMSSLSWFEFLRVLDLEDCKLGKRQDKIDLRYLGNLLHLRYLGLKYTGIQHLPSEIGKLQFLQTLDVRSNFIKELPSSVSRLRQLMCLSADVGTKIQVAGLGNLVSLEELSYLNVQDFSQDDFEELSNLTKLRVLKISLEEKLNESQHEALTDAIGNMHKLQSLRFRKVKRFNFMPKCINPSSLPLLSCLEIRVVEPRWDDIQVLGKLLALRFLDLEVLGSMEERPAEGGFVVTADAFPCLRYCHFDGFPIAPSMFPQGAMPMLRFFRFELRECDVTSGGLDLGMGHLPSLEEVSVELTYYVGESKEKVSDEKAKEAVALVRHAADAHPNHPTIHINRCVSYVRILAKSYN